MKREDCGMFDLIDKHGQKANFVFVRILTRVFYVESHEKPFSDCVAGFTL
jgi:hypothetical protein